MGPRPPAGWSEAIAAAALPPLIVLAARPRGDGLAQADDVLPVWAALAIALWLVLAALVPGPWGPALRVGCAAGASSIAAAVVAWLYWEW